MNLTTSRPIIYIWKEAPFIRLLIPFACGIVLQWNIQVNLILIATGLLFFGCTYAICQLLPVTLKYKLRTVLGVQLFMLMLATGCFTVYCKDTRNNRQWFGNYYQPGTKLIIRIDETLSEKAKSYKTTASVETVINGNKILPAKGKLLVYLFKDSLTARLQYGDKLVISKEVQPIKNTGNPGAFNYQRYAAFQQLFHNVFLKQHDFVLLKTKDPALFTKWIFYLRKQIVTALKKNIHGEDETAIAEALLIGYKDDLDQDLVQAYSNTGVVHIIAISGLHLGLIYIMLEWIFGKIPFLKRSKLLRVVFIVASLWLFTLITGASASVLRSAVMFSFIVLGKLSNKKASIFNSLAVSALVLLLIDPFFLWDVGFQLSYLAIISIVIFQKTVYSWFYIKNKWIDKIWQLAAVTIAAQLLTLPVCIYYFHQFPNLFLITNVIAVPLSSLILFAEIILLAFGWIPFAGFWIGRITSWLLWLMNKVILVVNQLLSLFGMKYMPLHSVHGACMPS